MEISLLVRDGAPEREDTEAEDVLDSCGASVIVLDADADADVCDAAEEELDPEDAEDAADDEPDDGVADAEFVLDWPIDPNTLLRFCEPVEAAAELWADPEALEAMSLSEMKATQGK